MAHPEPDIPLNCDSGSSFFLLMIFLCIIFMLLCYIKLHYTGNYDTILLSLLCVLFD
jgi:hypothetical protein